MVDWNALKTLFQSSFAKKTCWLVEIEVTVEVVENPESFLVDPSVVVDAATAADWVKLFTVDLIPVLNVFFNFLYVDLILLLGRLITAPSPSTTISLNKV